MYEVDLLSRIHKVDELKLNKTVISETAVIDERKGPVVFGENTQICHGAVLEGPLIIGKNCLIGNHAFIRGCAEIGNDVRIGFCTEIRGSIIGDKVTIGPQCFIADSIIERDTYLGAMVRTSNHRLDRKTVSGFHNGILKDTGKEKLGCFIRDNVSLGVQVIILPGREVAARTQLGPRIIFEKNLPTGNYKLRQVLQETTL